MQPSPPVAIRVVRPYDSEAQFLECEGETLSKTSVTLVGALHRPQGVILRFELTLTSGEALLRGEGRVTGFKERAFQDQPGLVLRFTRLDPKSKAFIDRATGSVGSMAKAPESTPLIIAADTGDGPPSSRVAVAAGPDSSRTLSPPRGFAPPPAPGAAAQPVSPDPPVVATPAVLAPPPPVEPAALQPSAATTSGPAATPRPPQAVEAGSPERERAPADAERKDEPRAAASPVEMLGRTASSPGGREQALERLRARRTKLTEEQVSHLLTRRG